MVASNTRDCFRACVGKLVTGVMFDALPVGSRQLATGTKTLIFDDGSGLTVAINGAAYLQIDRSIILMIVWRLSP